MDFLKPLAPITFMRSIARILRARPQVPKSLGDNALLAVLLNRRSVRSFQDQPIPDDVFAAILEAGRVAPSTVNLQTWSFATFTPAEWAAKFGRPLPFKAARAVIILADAHRARRVLDVFPKSPLVEYTLAVMNASLAAMAMNMAAEAKIDGLLEAFPLIKNIGTGGIGISQAFHYPGAMMGIVFLGIDGKRPSDDARRPPWSRPYAASGSRY